MLCILPHRLLAACLVGQSAPPVVEVPPPAGVVGAEPAATPADTAILERSQLGGDWWGARSSLARRGISVDIGLTNFFQGIASGGLRREFAIGGNFNLELNLDFGLMGVVPGGSLLVHGESRYGETVNADTGALTPVNTRGYFPLTDPIDEAVPFAVTEVAYTQAFGEAVSVTIGKLIVVDGDPIEFAGGRGVTQFLDSNFVYNSATSQTAPYASLGISVDVQPAEWITISNALFQTTDASTTSGFGNFDGGWTWWSQVSTQYEIGSLPGGINIGGLYAFDNDFAKIGGTAVIVPGGLALDRVSDSWALFAGAWQYLYAPDESTGRVDPGDGLADRRGFGLFARLGFGDPDANPVKWSASVGLGGRGLIPSRADDTWGLAYYHTEAQRSNLLSLLPLNSSTDGIEAYYNVALTPAIGVTFDVQVVDGIVSRADPALVLGMRLNVDF